MNVLPITDAKTKLRWISHRNKTQKENESIITKDENSIAFVSDFTSPVDYIPKTHVSHTKPVKSDKKSRPLSYTSENWIG